MSPAIPADEMVGLFRRALSGETPVQLLDRLTWDEAFAGDVRFRIGGYEVAIFNDCDQADYVDHAIAPDGRRTEFEEWFALGRDPVRELDPPGMRALEAKLREAQPG